MTRTTWLLTLTLAGTILTSSCAHRTVLPAVPTQTVETIQVISSDTTLTPEQKTQLIAKVIEATERTYQQILQRQAEQGKNIKETILQVLTLAASVAAIILGVQ